MADETGISWTDHTHNEWVGCSSPAGSGCDNCYARTMTNRFNGDFLHPRLTSEQNRNKPYKWNRKAEKTGVRAKVFCGSMMDFFDKNAPAGAREPLWAKIKETASLDWQLLTKRPSNIPAMLPEDWGDGYGNVWLGVTVENKRSGLRRLEQLRSIPARVRFLSVEPLLEDLGEIDLSGIHWVICGGESGRGYRAMEHAWAARVLAQCSEQGVSAYFKQWGGTSSDAGGCFFNGAEIKQWPIVEIKA